MLGHNICFINGACGNGSGKKGSNAWSICQLNLTPALDTASQRISFGLKIGYLLTRPLALYA